MSSKSKYQYGYNVDLKYKFVSTNKRTGFQAMLFYGILERVYDSKKDHSHVTCPFGYSNQVHCYLDGTEIVFQWYEIDEQNQEKECEGPNWEKLQNNCFGRLVPT